MRILPLIAAIPLLIVGCTDVAPTEEAGEPDVVLDIPGTTFWALDCKMIVGGAYLPAPLFPLRGPEKWQPGPLIPHFLVAYEFTLCEEVAWGPFVRGPVWFAIESHSRLNPPDKCLRGDGSFRMWMENIFISDEEIASYAREESGFPATFASFEWDNRSTSRADTRGMRMTVGVETTELSVSGAEVAWNGLGSRTRYFFATEEAVSSVRWSIRGEQEPGRAVTTATLRPPTAMGEAGWEDLVGAPAGEAWVERVDAEITQYADWNCNLKDGSGEQANQTMQEPKHSGLWR